ncbi:MAG: AGE family epimerase/isomerase [Planctomycetota bacterium]|nr:AGE family epimerase/isomerase [Planctomycetota bacterium]
MKTYRGIHQWLVTKEEPRNGFIPGVRPTESMVFDMINVNVSQELDSAIEKPLFRSCGLASARRILDLHVDRKAGLVFDNVAPDGSHPDTFAGRVILPGHALECLWFLISAGEKWGAGDIVTAAVEAIPDMLEFGWDSKYGGFFYYRDSLGNPPEQLEWDRKLWWVHGEALAATLLAYKHTGRKEFAQWFEKIHEYTWDRFGDSEFGEWFGYLDRAGEVFLDLKGGKWKGCFHVPRTLHVCLRILEDLTAAGRNERKKQ